LKTNVYKDSIKNCIEYVNGHYNTIESIALYQQSDNIILASSN